MGESMKKELFRMSSSLHRILLQALLAVVASQAHGGTVVCSGTVEQLAYHQPGRLMIRLSSMNVPVFICSADHDWEPAGSFSSTSPAACKTLYATLLAARLTRGTIGSMYFDGDEGPASCGAFSRWTSVNVRYFEY